jgi:peptidase E
MVKRGPKWNRSEIVFFQHFQGQALPPYLVGYHHIWKVPGNQPGKIQEEIIILHGVMSVVFEKIRNRTVSEAQNDLYGMIQTRSWM